ncbi:MAG TPA: helix-turn-helix domain-containing protein [Candidatus Saccharimonadales bacterium]
MKLHREPSKQTCTAQDKMYVGKAAEIVSKKWTSEILYALVVGPKRFSSLQSEAGDPNPRTLSARLNELEAAGIITKECFAEVPPRVEYALTSKGRDLVPIFEQMHAWGKRYTK